MFPFPKREGWGHGVSLLLCEPPGMRRQVLLFGLLTLGACDSGNELSPAKTDEPVPDPNSDDAAAKGAGAETPTPLPDAPQGAVLDAKGKLFVQACATEEDCPKLLQAKGVEHCAGLKLGDVTWRLPSQEEAGRFAKLEGLGSTSGYHWTSTPFDQDDSQVWIVDPSGPPSTTIPKDRKPFTIRCVAELK